MNCNILHYRISSLLHLSEMDPVGNDVIEFFLHLSEVELEKKRDKTRYMEEKLKADRAAMKEMEKERLMLMRERDRKLAVKKAVEKLVSDFLEADDNYNFDAQRGMENEIVALMSRDDGDVSNTGGSGCGVNGENISDLENTQNQDDRAGIATIEGNSNDDE